MSAFNYFAIPVLYNFWHNSEQRHGSLQVNNPVSQSMSCTSHMDCLPSLCDSPTQTRTHRHTLFYLNTMDNAEKAAAGAHTGLSGGPITS